MAGAMTAADEWRRAEAKAKREALELHLLRDIRALGLPEPEREFHFASPRHWRFDFAWLDRHVAVEVEGGTRSGGRHVKAQGYEDDAEKYNAAVERGWALYRFTSAMVTDGRAVALLERVLAADATAQ